MAAEAFAHVWMLAVAVLGSLLEEVWHLRRSWHARQLDAFASELSVAAPGGAEKT